jgi:hypothetical protein
MDFVDFGTSKSKKDFLAKNKEKKQNREQEKKRIASATVIQAWFRSLRVRQSELANLVSIIKLRWNDLTLIFDKLPPDKRATVAGKVLLEVKAFTRVLLLIHPA